MHAEVFLLLSLLAAAQVKPEQIDLKASPCSEASLPTDKTLNSELHRLAGSASGGGGENNNVVYQLEYGEHCVRQYSPVQHLFNMTFQGPAVIKCTNESGLAFFNMTELRLAHVTVSACGLKSEHIEAFFSTVKASIDYFFDLSNGSEQYIAVMVGDCANFAFEDSAISNTLGLGMLAINVMGNSTLNNVTIEDNVPNGCFGTNGLNFTTEKIGGGLIFSYHDYTTSSDNRDSYLEIVNSQFLGNSYCGYAVIYESYYLFDQTQGTANDLLVGAGGGLSLVLGQLQYQVDINVSNSEFHNNTALNGGGVQVQLFTGVPDSLVVFDECVFQSNGVDETLATNRNYSIVGSALAVLKDFVQPSFSLSRIRQHYGPSNLMFIDSSFVNNTAYAGTISISSLYSLVLADRSQSDIVFDNCTFEYNKAVVGAVLHVQEWKGIFLQLGTNVLLKDVRIDHNAQLSQGTVRSPTLKIGIIAVSNINLTISGESSIAHSAGTALVGISSSVNFLGNVSFLNNTGSFGGAVSLSGSSLIVVGKNTTLAFINNTGTVTGGAIYADYYSSILGPDVNFDCFLYFDTIDSQCISYYSQSCPDITQLGIEIIFEGNQAAFGNMIYGSTLNSCPWSRPFRDKYAPGMDNVSLLELLYDNFSSPFMFDTRPDRVSAVSTPTTLIDVQLPGVEEWNASIPLEVAPGIAYQFDMRALDAFNRSVPTVVTSSSLTPGTLSVIGESNYFFLNYNTSVNMAELVVHGLPNQSDVGVTLIAVASYADFTFLIDISPCPDGYILSDKTCYCSKYLLQNHFNCTSNGEVLVPYSNWIGRDQNGVLTFGYCNFDYCSSEISIVQVKPSARSTNSSSSRSTNSDLYNQQCREGYNRGGVACSNCAEGYSIVFGSNRCLRCSGRYLSLLLLFAVYGIFLIATIVFFQFTISEGYLNGVLFFANIITVYAPLYTVSPGISRYLIVFFWLSLKLGFEACFFDGMNALTSTALQFVFPLYLYFLLFVIVLLSRWSARFSRWLGYHGFSPAKLFATILVMTYSSLLETCIAVLSVNTLNDVYADKTSLRWGYDQSLVYFHGHHAALGVFAILLLVLFLIPAPFIWMFPSLIFSIKRLQKYKPIYDAVWAPLQPKFRFWVSLRLILRAIPLFIINVTILPVNLLLLCLFLLVLLFAHGVAQPFQRLSQNAIDNLFQVNLLAITLISLYFSVLNLGQTFQIYDVSDAIRSNSTIAQSDRIQYILIIFAVTSSYLAFTYVIIKHLLLRFPKLHEFVCYAWNVARCRKQQKGFSLGSSRRSSSSPTPYGNVTGDGEEDTENTSSGEPKKTNTTFSVLREPLLETSGLVTLSELDS